MDEPERVIECWRGFVAKIDRAFRPSRSVVKHLFTNDVLPGGEIEFAEDLRLVLTDVVVRCTELVVMSDHFDLKLALDATDVLAGLDVERARTVGRDVVQRAQEIPLPSHRIREERRHLERHAESTGGAKG